MLLGEDPPLQQWQPTAMRMKLARLCTSALFGILLIGCAGNIKLIEDGKVHHGSWDGVSNTLQVSIDGVPYKGTYTQNASSGTAVAFSGFRTASAFGTSSDGSGQALLLSPEGKVLRCVFGSVVAFRGQGQCQNNQGKVYDLLIGQ